MLPPEAATYLYERYWRTEEAGAAKGEEQRGERAGSY